MSRLQEQGRRMAEAVIEERQAQAKASYYLEVHEAQSKIIEAERIYADQIQGMDSASAGASYLRGLIHGLRMAEGYVKRIAG